LNLCAFHAKGAVKSIFFLCLCFLLAIWKIWMMGLGFPVFCKKTRFNQTGPVRFEPVFGSIQLIFHKINVIRFGWFFESKPNRTVNTPSLNLGLVELLFNSLL
jgi:hypothetical protein